jgi:hypothetical protein
MPRGEITFPNPTLQELRQNPCTILQSMPEKHFMAYLSGAAEDPMDLVYRQTVRASRVEVSEEVKFIGKKRRIRQAQTELSKKSLELGVFGLGLLEDGDIGVGVFP